jgi:N-acetylglucosaminyldiphosphoundecaprenol N-acetyl-beta-D-mannosaminyltransferase
LSEEIVIIGGVPTLRTTRAALAERMVLDVARARQGALALPLVVSSSNGAVIADFHSKPAFRNTMLQADIIDADGMPLVMASWLFCKKPLEERVATTDFIHNASASAVQNGIKFFFLGAHPGVAQRAADNLKLLHPGLQIVGCRQGYFNRDEEASICEEIRQSGADVLWIGLGSPQQETFAIANRERLAGLAWIRTCGGLFDHCAGRFRRAPRWVQNIGMEWLFRAAQEPMRLSWRYARTNPVAVYHLVTKTHD